MAKNNQKQLKPWAIAVLCTVVLYLFDSLFGRVYNNFIPVLLKLLYSTGIAMPAQIAISIIDFIKNFLLIILTVNLCYKLALNRKPPKAATILNVILASLCIGVYGYVIQRYLMLGRIPYQYITYIQIFVHYLIFLVMARAILKKDKLPTVVATDEAAPAEPAPAVVPMYEKLENFGDLCDALLGAARIHVANPLSAVLCSKDALQIAETDNGYQISGYIQSENAKGKTVYNNFTATVSYDDFWTVNEITVDPNPSKH